MASDEDLNRALFERDLAVRQAKLAHTSLHVIRMALNENRPLEALRQTNEIIDELDEELDTIEEWGDGSQGVPDDAE